MKFKIKRSHDASDRHKRKNFRDENYGQKCYLLRRSRTGVLFLLKLFKIIYTSCLMSSVGLSNCGGVLRSQKNGADGFRHSDGGAKHSLDR